MPNLRILIIPFNQTQDSKTDQFFAPTLDDAKKELKKWAENGHHGRYSILQTHEVLVEQGEC